MFKKLLNWIRYEEPLALSGVAFGVGDFLQEQASWHQAAIAAFVLIARQWVTPAKAAEVSTIVDAVVPELPADPRLTALEADVKDILARIGA